MVVDFEDLCPERMKGTRPFQVSNQGPEAHGNQRRIFIEVLDQRCPYSTVRPGDYNVDEFTPSRKVWFSTPGSDPVECFLTPFRQHPVCWGEHFLHGETMSTGSHTGLIGARETRGSSGSEHGVLASR